ncbi:hypothetical protein PGT21_017426 [Puccinia graminis f. sp. tritici]|uniref:Uncharacterized protein n=1 Tax=Puccinia graminis f. sp. tritici TaxID=56615 RepID=A0A5B0PN19_PUCGR|nr:hypothetical protein PGT21_017426 [Puccinia graminis f. sp. tritici]
MQVGLDRRPGNRIKCTSQTTNWILRLLLTIPQHLFRASLKQSHIRSGTTLDPKEAALEGSVGGGAYAKWDMQNTPPPSRMQNDMLA